MTVQTAQKIYILFSIPWSMSAVYSIELDFIDYLLLRISFLLPQKQIKEQCSCCFVIMTKLVKTFMYLSQYQEIAFVYGPGLGHGFWRVLLIFPFIFSLKSGMVAHSVWNVVVWKFCSADGSLLTSKYVCILIMSLSLLSSLGILMWFSCKRSL